MTTNHLEHEVVKLRDQLRNNHGITVRERPAERPLEEWVTMLRDSLADADAHAREIVEHAADEAVRRERESGLPQEPLPATAAELDELSIHLDREYNDAAVRAAQAVGEDPAVYKRLVDERDCLEALSRRSETASPWSYIASSRANGAKQNTLLNMF